VDANGFASGESAFPDPLAALNAQFVDARVSASFDKWGSIVFHNGTPRVLCAKIFKKQCQVEFILYNADTDEAVGTMKAQEPSRRHEFNIEARPTAGCAPTQSARLNLDGPIVVVDRIERSGPSMVFGDWKGNVFGRAYEAGNYTISADFYSGKNLGGDLVVSGQLTFEILPPTLGGVDPTPAPTECGDNGSVCPAEFVCCNGLVCQNGQCCGPIFANCFENADCCSGYTCIDSECQ
jgi:hypothetical protein